jgi:hypothetical protein
MLLAAAHKLGAGLSTLGIAGFGSGIGVVFAGLLIPIYFNPIEPTFCGFFYWRQYFHIGVTDSPTKIFSEVKLKDDVPSKIPEPYSKDLLD